MSTNFQRAWDIAEHIADVDESTTELVKQLDAAGLIAPDLPAPDREPTGLQDYFHPQPTGEWEVIADKEYVGVFPGLGEVDRTIDGQATEPLTPEQARRIGLVWLAAARLADEESHRYDD